MDKAVYSGTRDRLTGYFQVLAEIGIDPMRVPIYQTDNDEETTSAGLDYIFSLREPPTAILAMSDKVALHAMDWLGARGLCVPREVSIVGFDGIPEGGLTPPLTTIGQPMADMGRRAVETILGFDGTVRRETMQAELVVRRSTRRWVVQVER